LGTAFATQAIDDQALLFKLEKLEQEIDLLELPSLASLRHSPSSTLRHSPSSNLDKYING